ncbi:hypothetical protein [Pseudomonas umsongensis]|uniref:hypothetical protein n=1 Tax=Pseudomonas umsongensis TaxID=198618 RepID=UPI003ECF8B09
MTDKMRDQFEAWALTHFINSETMSPLERDEGEPEEYRFSRVNMAWVAWQASRAALVVDWPDHYAYTNSDVAGAAILDCRTAFGKAVKVKP